MNQTSGEEIRLNDLAVGLMRILRKHWVLWLVGSVAGIVTATGLWSTRPQEYESRMSVVSEVLPHTFGDRFTAELSSLIADQNWNTMSSRIHLSKDEVALIRSIKVETLNREESRPYDASISETVEISTFVFTVRVLDNKVLPRLQEGILKALNENELAVSQSNYRSQRNNQIIEKIDAEIRNLETIKNRLLSDPGSKQPVEADLFAVSVELLEKKLRYQRNQGGAAVLFESFVPHNHPAGPSLMRWMGAGWLIGLIIGGAILLFKKLLEESKA